MAPNPATSARACRSSASELTRISPWCVAGVFSFVFALVSFLNRQHKLYVKYLVFVVAFIFCLLLCIRGFLSFVIALLCLFVCLFVCVFVDLLLPLQASQDTPIIVALNMFAERRISALPIVDASGKGRRD